MNENIQNIVIFAVVLNQKKYENSIKKFSFSISHRFNL